MAGLLAIGAVTSIGLGAILVFAVDWRWQSADRPLVGLIMMAVGMIALAAASSLNRSGAGTGGAS
ncbi:hypothetical protein QCN29_03850 [Streptomyces sp. HNM0663]|uniref:Uncharacterized protein n=1 Tax=Streptomyces chengmaiensis TaxID=3040919 RepID=A0ABT6HJ79_9ACTN|nr:hypothetical protein [Streptomyces chengmaiensis]MDH2387934.1 hypothetical protein [Streptomyces chengmaiensis]